MSSSLQVLLTILFRPQVHGDPTVMVTGITQDSRAIQHGSLFVAIRGTQHDGHAFIANAIAAGAQAVVCEALPQEQAPGVTYVVVPDSALALGLLAAQWYGHPSRQLELVGITGTNGKTSSVQLLYDLFQRTDHKAGMLSTTGNAIAGQPLPATLTTPGPMALQGLLADMVQAGCTHAFMEVSSHALVQQRTAGLQFAGGVFTNLTHEHLDYHKTFKAYLQAKKSFFDQLPAAAFALVNTDDPNGKVMVQNTAAQVHTLSLRGGGDFTARILTDTLQGLELHIEDQPVWLQLAGRFNAYNALTAYAVARLLGVTRDEALVALSACPPVRGRLERLQLPSGICGVVDYAHTPDALEKVLQALVHTKGPSAHLLTVVGCGGNRDTTKRPRMAQLAVQYSDKVVLTSDNPRHEAPEAILQDMLAGLAAEQQKGVLSIVDRQQAIKVAHALAQPGDIVLVAGKGHETYQDIAGEKLLFDDREVLLALEQEQEQE